MIMNPQNTVGIIILYKPNWEISLKTIESACNQVKKLYVVDNTPGVNNYNKISFFPPIKYISLGENKGIAHAQNIALKEILNENFDFVFFLDQDSLIIENTVQNLINKYSFLNNNGFKIGGIGPRPFDRDLNKEYKGSIKKGKKLNNNLTEVNEIISSASLIPTKNFKEIGLMDSTLFIDGVDHEWCWRAKKKGDYKFFIDEDTLLSHKLGEGDKKILGINVHIPTPFRTYYQFRNYFYLSRRSYVPIYWKISNGIKYFIKFFYYSIFLNPRKEYFKNIIRGINDALKFR